MKTTQPDNWPDDTGLPRSILVVIHSLHGGGAERVAVDLSGEWARAGSAVTVVTLASAQDDAYVLHPSVKRVALDMAGASGGGVRGLLANVSRVRALRAEIIAARPDVVLGMMTTASVLAVLAARGLPVRVIATEHTHPPSQSLSGLWLRLRRWTYPRAHRVVALTRDTATWIETHVPGSKMAVIPNPVHWPLPHEEPVVPPPRSEGRMLLAVGRLHPDKGFDMLLDAFGAIAAQLPQWRLVILGEGTQRAALTAKIAQLGLQDRVSLPGRVGNVDDWYAAADLYVLSSRVEGLSNTLLEAMASGLAAVAFDCETGPREIVHDGVDGLLVRPAADPQSLARALESVMSDDARLQSLAEQALLVRERFSMARVSGLWRDVFSGPPAQARGQAGTATSADS